MKLTGARWSAACRCPRWGAYTALEIPAAEPDDLTKRYFARGHLFEGYVIRQLQAKHGSGNVLPQVPIPWGNGWIGHADALIETKDGGLLVEVVSTTSLANQLDAKLLQLRGYWRHAENHGIQVDSGVLYVVNPSDLRGESSMPVTLTDEHRATVDALTAQIVEAANGGTLPACSKASPTECRYAFCPYTELAWANWEPPPLEDVPATPELLEDLEAWTFAKEAEADLTRRAKSCLEQRRAVERRLADEYQLPVGDFHVAGYKVRRTQVKGRETFQWSRAVKAGAVRDGDYERLGAFLSVGDGSERWTVERSGEPAGAMADVDYGAVPF